MNMATLGRAGGYSKAAKYSPEELTGPARRGFWAKWEREVDPEGKLSEAERQRRAQALLKSHMTKLALKSSRKRKRT